MDPIDARADVEHALQMVAEQASRYVAGLDDRPARAPDADTRLSMFGGALPEEGQGTLAPLRDLLDAGIEAATHSAGPRFFHFVIGGVTPAALAADWLTSAIDQNGGLWDSSPLATHLEVLTTDWLLDLFELPRYWGGGLTKSATLANFAGLACARDWWGDRHGVDVPEAGLSDLPRVPVLSSGYIHASARKALAMLGIGRGAVETFARDGTGRLDVDAMERALHDLDGAPAILIGNAGEVNTGDFDPLDAMADLAERYGAWLHVDGAFGLFTRISPEARHLTAGIERAHSVISDGHKWLNVPYDCGMVFVRDPTRLARSFGLPGAAYLKQSDESKPNYAMLLPDSSRRARAISVYATLRAYGRDGYRDMVERHLRLAQHLSARIERETDFELVVTPRSNIVCFRYRPAGMEAAALDELNSQLGRAILEDGRVFVGTSVLDGRVVFRPAIVNFRSTEAHVDELIDVMTELAHRL